MQNSVVRFLLLSISLAGFGPLTWSETTHLRQSECEAVVTNSAPQQTTMSMKFELDLPFRGSSLDEIRESLKKLAQDVSPETAAAWVSVSLHAHQPVPVEFFKLAMSDHIVSLIKPFPRLRAGLNSEKALDLETRLKLLQIHLAGQHTFSQRSLVSLFHRYLQILNSYKYFSRNEALLAMELIYAQGFPEEQVLQKTHHPLAGIFLGVGMSDFDLAIYSALCAHFKRFSAPGVPAILPTHAEFRSARFDLEKLILKITGTAGPPRATMLIAHQEIMLRLREWRLDNPARSSEALAVFQKRRAEIIDVFQTELGINIQPRYDSHDYGLLTLP